MLKPAERPVDDDRPIGELVHQLVEDGKSYARAELGVVKAIASAKGKAAAVPAALIGGAFLLIQAAVVMLAFALFSTMFAWIGPVAAALVTVVVFAGLAFLLVRLAQKKLRELT